VKKLVEWGGTPNATGRGANGMLGMLTEAHLEDYCISLSSK